MKLLSRKLFESSVKDLFKDVYHGDINLSFKSLSELPDDLPDEVVGDFSCAVNKLISLKGCPKRITGNFSCSSNNLESLEGAPEEVGGDFFVASQKNGRQFNEEDVRTVCKVGGKIIINR